jgi:hypothetical protein
LLLVSASVSAHSRSGSPLLARNLVRLHEVAVDARRAVLLNRVTNALCRLIVDTDESVCVFLSHAKSDGIDTTKKVRTFLQTGTGVDDFFDAQDLVEGSKWADVIRGSAARNVLLAIRTDAYATREWCRTEVLEAKLGGSPVIVLDALATFEPRGFPYLGNTPSVRWSGQNSQIAMEHLLSVILRETLRFRHFPARVADLCRAYHIPGDFHILPRPPELLTALRALSGDRAAAVRLVYPDPPLGTDELALIAELARGVEALTPTGLVARRWQRSALESPSQCPLPGRLNFRRAAWLTITSATRSLRSPAKCSQAAAQLLTAATCASVDTHRCSSRFCARTRVPTGPAGRASNSTCHVPYGGISRQKTMPNCRS